MYVHPRANIYIIQFDNRPLSDTNKLCQQRKQNTYTIRKTQQKNHVTGHTNNPQYPINTITKIVFTNVRHVGSIILLFDNWFK